MLGLLVALLSGGFGGFLLATGRDILKDKRARRKRWAFSRRLLAHHATTLIEDADEFLRLADECRAAQDGELAARFRDVNTHERGYIDQVKSHLDDLSDELIDLIRDLESASAEAATWVAIVQRASAEMFEKMSAMQSYAIGMSLREQFDHAEKTHREMRKIALGVLQQLDDEDAVLPVRSRDALASARNAKQLASGVRAQLAKSTESDS
jgi:hypothetical protein